MSTSKFVAVACDSAAGLAGAVNGHFGQTPFFVVAEIAGNQLVSATTVRSPGHGEGCGMPTFVHGLGVSAVIVGGIGGGALHGLAARGIEVIPGVSGKVEDVLKSYAVGLLIAGKPGCGGHGGHGGQGGHGDHSHGCGHDGHSHGGHHHN
jgi:predicted Fe-Mo cluster-binding NifX family protein